MNNSNNSKPTSIESTLLEVDTYDNNLAFSLRDVELPSSLYKNDALEVLNLPSRIENALKKSGMVTTVGHLFDVPIETISNIGGVGKLAVRYITEVRNAIVREYGILKEEGEFQDKFTEEGNKMLSLLINTCGKERSKEVIRKRYGLLSGEHLTLEEIGDTYGLTRERVRQIQSAAIKRMRHSASYVRIPLTQLIEDVLFTNGGILSEEEADAQLPNALGGINEDGSSVLDLLMDLGWIQSCKVGDIKLYSPIIDNFSISDVSNKIIQIFKNEGIGMSIDAIKAKVKSFERIKDERFDPWELIKRYCEIDPRIVEENMLLDQKGASYRYYAYFRSGYFPTRSWIKIMSRVLKDCQEPLHYTEIADRVNDLLDRGVNKLDPRRAHCILIESDKFAHSGIRGTYGLTTWGFRKETTPELIVECLNKAGYPLHWKQIFHYVSKYKDSKQGSIISVLYSNVRFKQIRDGVFWFKNDPI